MKTLIVAPHPDDELLGCGGTLLRCVAEGRTVAWLLMTNISEEAGWPTERALNRVEEINYVREGLQVLPQHMYELSFPTTELDRIPLNHLIEKISVMFAEFPPEEVLMPFPGDVHSEHRIIFEAASACTKWFRYPSVRRTLAYETASETDFRINPCISAFQPNVFVNIKQHLSKKIELMNIFQTEVDSFLFPRSAKALKSLTNFQGSQSGFEAAETFVLLREAC